MGLAEKSNGATCTSDDAHCALVVAALSAGVRLKGPWPRFVLPCARHHRPSKRCLTPETPVQPHQWSSATENTRVTKSPPPLADDPPPCHPANPSLPHSPFLPLLPPSSLLPPSLASQHTPDSRLQRILHGANQQPHPGALQRDFGRDTDSRVRVERVLVDRGDEKGLGAGS